MGKESGLGAQLYVDGNDLSGDTGMLSKISKSLKPIPMTGINKFATERVPGQLDGAINWGAFYNPTGAHPVLATLPRTDRVVSYYHRATLGVPVASIVAKQIDYPWSRAEDGKLDLKVETLANAYWLDWGYALTAGKRTDTGATNGTGVDFANQGAPASFGLQAYLHVFAFTGTSATIKLQGSSDNGGGDAFADITGGGFTLVTGLTSERIATARNLAVERYMRVVTTGTFSNLQFAVMACVNRTDMTI